MVRVTDLKSLLTDTFNESFKRDEEKAIDLACETMSALRSLGYSVNYKFLNEGFWKKTNSELELTDFLMFVDINGEHFYVQLAQTATESDFGEEKYFYNPEIVSIKTGEDALNFL